MRINGRIWKDLSCTIVTTRAGSFQLTEWVEVKVYVEEQQLHDDGEGIAWSILSEKKRQKMGCNPMLFAHTASRSS